MKTNRQDRRPTLEVAVARIEASRVPVTRFTPTYAESIGLCELVTRLWGCSVVKLAKWYFGVAFVIWFVLVAASGDSSIPVTMHSAEFRWQIVILAIPVLALSWPLLALLLWVLAGLVCVRRPNQFFK